MILPFMLASSIATATACGPAPSLTTTLVRARRWRQVGQCDAIPVWRARRTDSAMDDLRAWLADGRGPAVFWTLRPSAPRSEEPGWPTPRGNLYVAWPAPMAEPLLSVERTISAWIQDSWPELDPHPLGAPGDYGGVRVGERFVAGVAVGRFPEGTLVGVDVHLDASPAAYRRLNADDEHVSLRTLTGEHVGPAWALLSRLVGEAGGG